MGILILGFSVILRGINMHIQVSKLSKSFGGQDVLKDVSFAINSGEKVVYWVKMALVNQLCLKS